MRHLLILALVVVVCLDGIPASAQKNNPGTFSNASVDITCPDGIAIHNGVEVHISAQPGAIYTATAVGIHGFDPILAVSDSNGVQQCMDNAQSAAGYTVNLPTTGYVQGSPNDAQVTFSARGTGSTDISLVVGSASGVSGQFALILEGLALTPENSSGRNAGDRVQVRVTQNIVDSSLPLTTYMISESDSFDPLMQVVGANNRVIVLSDGSQVECDDAGDPFSCWGQSQNLIGSFIGFSANSGLSGGPQDSMLSLPLDQLQLDADPNNNLIRYLMTTAYQGDTGNYVVVFHIGIGKDRSSENLSATAVPNAAPTQQSQVIASVPDSLQSKDKIIEDVESGAVRVTCPDGTAITNAIEMKIHMRPGLAYTATALGLNGFGPAVAVSDQNGMGECLSSKQPVQYSLRLPTTGLVAGSPSSVQVGFADHFSSESDASLVIGSTSGADGEFVLVLQGMTITSEDNFKRGTGDLISARVTQNMVTSGRPLTVYMISTSQSLDPLVEAVDGNQRTLLDNVGQPIACDDAGDFSSCWGQSASLRGSFVSQVQGQQFAAGAQDAMLSIPLDQLSLDSNLDKNFLRFLMTSYQRGNAGDYLAVFDVGIGKGSDAVKPDA